MPIVSVQASQGYDSRAMDIAVSAHFEALGVAADLTPGTRVLLKPNLLTARDFSAAVTTHPALLCAIARWLKAHGIVHITLADSCGGLYNAAVLRKLYTACGMDSLADLLTLNTEVSSFEKNGFTLIKPIQEADYIINCPKLKTHGLTVMTAGVKNLFGCIPGLRKPEIHCLKPTIDSFSKLLIGLSQTVAPQLTLLDAVDCMEGNGPGSGTVRHMGYTLCSRSIYALDEQAAILMDIRPSTVPLIRHSRAMGLMDEATTLVGDPLLPADPPFTLPDAIIRGEQLLSRRGLFHFFLGRKKVTPIVITGKCIGCGRCAESCPKQIIQIKSGKAVIVRKRCISCLCCQEMCPAHAIDVQTKRIF